MNESYLFSDIIQKSVIIHIPHASTAIPTGIANYDLSLLQKELTLSTDLFTDNLFKTDLTTLCCNFSRLFCDVERFIPDEMDKYGRGFYTTRTASGDIFRLDTDKAIALNLYTDYHTKFTALVTEKIQATGFCTIVDCHSFNENPLPFEKAGVRPDVCVGIDDFHTPQWLKEYTVSFFEGEGFTVNINFPYSGAIVPKAFYNTDARVRSVMIELNKRVYKDNTIIGSFNKKFNQFLQNLY